MNNVAIFFQTSADVFTTLANLEQFSREQGYDVRAVVVRSDRPERKVIEAPREIEATS